MALDLGGTNFRVLVIEFDDGKFSMDGKIFAVPKDIMIGPGIGVSKIKNLCFSSGILIIQKLLCILTCSRSGNVIIHYILLNSFAKVYVYLIKYSTSFKRKIKRFEFC